MEISITGKDFEVTEAIRNYIIKRIGHLEKYFRRDNDWAKVVIKQERGEFLIEVSMGGGKAVIFAETRTPDMYASIDEVAEKIKKQVKKYKERNKDEKKRLGRLAFRKERTSFSEDGSFQEDQASENIIKRQLPFEKPMSVEEARMQLDVAGNVFFVFYNSETQHINIIYKRKDGKYGLFAA